MKSNASAYRNIVLISQLSINVMVPIFLCLIIGIWLDGKFGTGYITIIALVLGIAAGARNGYMTVKGTIDAEERRRKREEEEEIARKVANAQKKSKSDGIG